MDAWQRMPWYRYLAPAAAALAAPLRFGGTDGMLFEEVQVVDDGVVGGAELAVPATRMAPGAPGADVQPVIGTRIL